MSEQLEPHKISCLPPPHVRLTSEEQQIITPLDDRGLIDIPELIQNVKETIHPDYTWPTKETNVHHFYWPAAQYPYLPDEINTALFRNQPINKGRMPIIFHNWLHRVTIPPPVPEAEVIVHHMDAWNVTRSLFHNVKNARHWQRRVEKSRRYMHGIQSNIYKDGVTDDVDIEMIEQIMDKHFIGVDECRVKLDSIHPDFQIIDPDEPFEGLVRTLGKIMAPSSLLLTRTVTTE
jgi:hypothetical protein